MSSITTSHSELISNIPESFKNAHDSGDLLFFPSTVAKHSEFDIEFEIRTCPALQKKPTTRPVANPVADAGLAIQGDQGRSVDPFAPPYNVRLHVGNLKGEDGDDFVVLLNKYSVVQQHFLLVTKEFKLQSSPLEPSELLQTYLLLSAARVVGKPFFAFFNCGDNSGASQPHKHIQFLPYESPGGPPIEKLASMINLERADRPFSIRRLPYANHVFRFPQHLNSLPIEQLEETLSTTFLSLLDQAISTIRHDPNYPPGRPSYNVIITTDHMHLIPRSRESHILEDTGDKVSVNALGFIGMLLVKSEEELEAVKKETVGNILCSLGVQSVDDVLVNGTTDEVPS